MLLKFDLEDNFPLNKTVELPIMTIVVRAVFHENKKYYPRELNVSIKYKNDIL